jgi:transcriptional regulator GlxA family with amidase domain
MERPASDLSLKRLAEVANLSPYYFLRLFRSVMRETPHHFVARVRMDRAKDLLAGKTYSVTDICFMVGFQSMGSFSRIFHKATGWTPSIYRSRAWEMSSHPTRFIPGCYIRRFGFAPYLGSAAVNASK